MKKLFFLLFLCQLAYISYGQSPVVISQPYKFQKWVSVKDSLLSDQVISSGTDSSHKVPTTAYLRKYYANGGSGTNFYNANGTFTSNRIADLGSHSLNLGDISGGNGNLLLMPGANAATLQAWSGNAKFHVGLDTIYMQGSDGAGDNMKLLFSAFGGQTNLDNNFFRGISNAADYSTGIRNGDYTLMQHNTTVAVIDSAVNAASGNYWPGTGAFALTGSTFINVGSNALYLGDYTTGRSLITMSGGDTTNSSMNIGSTGGLYQGFLNVKSPGTAFTGFVRNSDNVQQGFIFGVDSAGNQNLSSTFHNGINRKPLQYDSSIDTNNFTNGSLVDKIWVLNRIHTSGGGAFWPLTGTASLTGFTTINNDGNILFIGHSLSALVISGSDTTNSNINITSTGGNYASDIRASAHGTARIGFSRISDGAFQGFNFARDTVVTLTNNETTFHNGINFKPLQYDPSIDTAKITGNPLAIPDVQWVLAHGGGGVSYTGTNGLTLTGSVFTLGGALTATTLIDGSSGNALGIGDFSSNKALVYVDPADISATVATTTPLSNAVLQLNGSNLSLSVQNISTTHSSALLIDSAKMQVIDALNGVGLQLAADYSASYATHPRAVPDVAYVLAHAGTTYTAGNGLSLTGTVFKLDTAIAQTVLNLKPAVLAFTNPLYGKLSTASQMWSGINTYNGITNLNGGAVIQIGLALAGTLDAGGFTLGNAGVVAASSIQWNNAAVAARVWTLPDKTGTFAMTSDLSTGANPTGAITFTPVNGSSTNFTRSDGVPKADSTVIQSVAGVLPKVAVYGDIRYARLNAANLFTNGFTNQYSSNGSGSSYPNTIINNVGVTNSSSSTVATTMQSGAFAYINNSFTGVLVMTPTANRTITFPDASFTVGNAQTANPLSQFASTTSAQLRTVLSDETGTGFAYFQGGDAGTPSALVGTNISGTAASLTAGNVTTNANLTGPITSVGNATSIASQTGTGTTFAMSVRPSLSALTGSLASTITASTPTGTAGTDSVVVKTSLGFRAISPTYYGTGGGGGTPGGSTTQLQYNNAGAFNGISGATSNGTTVTLTNPVIGATTYSGVGAFTFTPTITANTTPTFPTGAGTVPYIANANTWPALQTHSTTGTGTTVTNKVLLTDADAATVGAQKYSAALAFIGNGWKTASTAGSQPVEMDVYLAPVQGTTNPSYVVNYDAKINGGTATNMYQTFSNGDIVMNATAQLSVPNTILTNSISDYNNVNMGQIQLGSRVYLAHLQNDATTAVVADQHNPSSTGRIMDFQAQGNTLSSVNQDGSFTMPAINIGLAGKIGIAEGTGGRVGQTTLVAGTKAITITGLTTSSRAILTFVSVGGTVSTTWQYAGVCTSNTLTITALTNANTTDTTDTSTLNYEIIN